MTVVLVETIRGRSRWTTCLALPCILALAFGLRVYRLGDQSVWYDEFISVSHVDAPDLGTYLRLQQGANWNLVPVYYSLQYFWANTVTDSIAGLRILSLLFGMAAIPLLYLVGRDLFGRSAGLVAALLLALSPAHIYQAQELRNYAVSLFFAVLSAYTFVKVVRGGGLGWWTGHVLANALLVWTHLFGVFLLLPEGCFLLLFRRRDFHRTGAWFLAHLLLMASLYLWVRGLDINPPSCSPPEAWMIPGNLFLDCLSVTWSPGVVAGIPWQNAPPAWMHTLERVYGLAEYVHPGVFFAALMVFILTAMGRAPRPSAETETEKRHTTLENAAFAVLWLLAPVLTVFVLTRLWRPDIFSAKYTNWASLAAYLIVGGAVAGLPRAGLRRAAVGVFILLYAYRLAFAFTYPQRTEWNAATRYLKDHAAERDTVVLTSWIQGPVFRYVMRPTGLPIASVDGFVPLCENIETHLANGHGVWALMVGRFDDFRTFERLQRYLNVRRAPYTAAGFMGMQPILMVHAVPGEDHRPASDPGVIAALRQNLETEGEDPLLRAWVARLIGQSGDHAAALEEFQRARPGSSDELDTREAYLDALEEAGEFGEAIAFFLEQMQLEAPQDYARLAKLHERAGRPDEAIRTYRDGIERHPHDALLHVDLGVAFAVSGRTEEAIAEYQSAIVLSPNRPWGYLSLARLLEAKGRYDEAFTHYASAAAQPPAGNGGRIGQAQILEKMGKRAAAQQIYALAVTEAPAEGPLGLSIADPACFEAAAQTCRAAIAAEPEFYLYYNELDALYLLRGDADGRVAEWRRQAAEHPEAARAHWHLGLALLAAGDSAGACAALRRAADLDPSNWTMQVNLGLALQEAGNFEGAATAFGRARDLAPGQGHVRVMRIEALLAVQDFDAAGSEIAACRKLGVELPRDLVEKAAAGKKAGK